MRYLIYSFFALVFLACGEESQNDRTIDIFTDEETSLKDEEKIVSTRVLKELKNASKVVYALPSPVEMADILHETKAVYDVQVLSNPASTSNYVTDYMRALNLGVYFADLSFTSMFDYPQEAMKFMGSAQAMSDELNIQGVFTEEVMMRLEENMSNKDSLIDIVSSTYVDTDLYLQDNERPIIAKAILAGAWMEGLYIAVNLETDSNRANVVWEKIGEQKPALSNLVNMLEDCNDNQFDSLVNELKTLVNIFDRVELNYEKSTTKSPEVLNVKISEDLFRQIQKKTSDIRDGIIN
ncbi:MAG: hypothetical protein CMP67_07645 [Flavobacteriales bacterium]|nr:hypothetical protein [Flavobacteriales bacterium]|tara:strand:- start:1388 stop:2272 length:885 start_codon:yes stop_codon:yes gene_type:complete